MLLRNNDIFVKPRADLRSKSVTGGAITLIAGSTAALLFVAQIYSYIVGSTQHTLHLTESFAVPMLAQTVTDPFQSRMYDIKGKMPLKIHVTFPHITCSNLEVKLNGAVLSKDDFDMKVKRLEKRRPNPVELKEAGYSPDLNMGCTLRGTLRVPIVAGHVTIALTKSAWTVALNNMMIRSQGEVAQLNDELKNQFNVTHFIHNIQYGKRFNKAASHPLEKRKHVIENSMGGLAMESIQVKLVPTVQTGLFTSQKSYQLSVVTHTVQPETMVSQAVAMMPGLSIGYDVTPLAVHHNEGRDNFFVFLSSLVSIVGGVFVTVGLLTGCLVHSAAAAVSKKVD